MSNEKLLGSSLLVFLIAALLPVGLGSGIPNFTTYGPDSGLTGEVVSVMTANRKDIWVNTWYPTSGGANGGLSIYSFKNDNWTTYTRAQGLAADVLQGLGIDPEGNVWICHALGVQVFDASSHEFVADYGSDEGLLGAAENVAFQGENMVWVATTEGIGRFDRSKDEWEMFTTEDGLVHDKVFSIAVDEDVLWIGTGSGASRYDTSTGEWRSYTTSDGLADDIVNKVVTTGKHVWLATRSGLSRLNKNNEKIKNFGKAQGLPSDNIVDVAVFRDRVWVATSDGVGKYEGRWKIVDEKDGLPVRKVSSIATQKDYIWFGTPSGVAKYGPLGPGLSFGSPYFLVIILGVAGGVILLVIRPGAKKTGETGEPRGKRRKEPTQKPSYEICGGVPQSDLCTRCKFYALKGDTVHCAKHKISIVFRDEPEAKRLKQIRKHQGTRKPREETEEQVQEKSTDSKEG